MSLADFFIYQISRFLVRADGVWTQNSPGEKTALTCIYSKRFIECDANIRLDGKNTKIMEDIYMYSICKCRIHEIRCVNIAAFI